MNCSLASIAPLLASALSPVLVLGACATTPDFDRELPDGASALIEVADPAELPDLGSTWTDRDEVLVALDHSLAWTRRTHALQFFPIAGITHRRALASLERLREILLDAPDGGAFDRAVREEFTVYKSAGWDGRGGGVLFTAYYTPILDGQLVPDPVHAHPLYALPDDLVKGPGGEILGWQTVVGLMPFPSRRAIEASHLLADRGLELVYLRNPMDAYIAHVNGSAFIRLPDGGFLRLGYAGKNGRAYTSLGRELLEDGKVSPAQLSLAGLREWARTRPEEVEEYLGRNDAFVFFQPIEGTPHGSLDFEVSALRSLATDKTLFPRGAAVVVSADHTGGPDRTDSPEGGSGEAFRRLMFDQDTGGAIRTAGRADIYAGIGEGAGDLAGGVKAQGQLYYLFLRP